MIINIQIFIFSLLVLINQPYSTEQEPDLLIIGNETFYLQVFPLENLDLQVKPFGNTDFSAPSTACWRGYRAIWRINNDSIFLNRIIRCNTDTKTDEQNIKELFNKNSIKYEANNELIFAEWITLDLFLSRKKVLSNKSKGNKNLYFSIQNGIIIFNFYNEE